MNLAKEISFLLYKHNCVILPGFGAFLLHEKPAEHNEIAKYVLPKKRTVTFNRQIINNDGLVANYISTVHKCTYEQGIEKINAFTQSLWDTLKIKRNVEIVEIGTFYYTQENKLVFVPHLSVNFDISTYGLPKLKIKPLVPKTETAVILEPHEEGGTRNQTLYAPADNSKKTNTGAEQTLTKIKEVDITLAAAKTKKRTEQLQENKRVKHEKKGNKKSKISVLAIVNTLGIFFLLGMTFALFQFEKNQTSQLYVDQEIASLLLENPITATTLEQASETSFGIFAETRNGEEAIQLVNLLRHKYENATIDTESEKNTSVFVISFSSQELAQEYKNLLQNIMEQKLVIRQK